MLELLTGVLCFVYADRVSGKRRNVTHIILVLCYFARAMKGYIILVTNWLWSNYLSRLFTNGTLLIMSRIQYPVLTVDIHVLLAVFLCPVLAELL